MSMFLLFFVIGALVGSFLNVCIYRLPLDQSIAYPASHCPHCKHKLNALDLFPLLSFLVLRGKCRYCQVAIPARYFMVELLTALLFGASSMVFVDTSKLFFSLYFIASLIVIFFIDWEHMVISDWVVFPAIGMALFFQLLNGNVVMALLGAFVGGAVLFCIGFFGEKIYKKPAMGEGDYFLGILLGAFFGWQFCLLAIFLAFIIAFIFVLPFLLFKKLEIVDQIAFGPALATSALVVLFFGQQILDWYWVLMVK